MKAEFPNRGKASRWPVSFNGVNPARRPLTRTLPVGLADSYASMRIEVGSAYTLIFILVILPILWMLQGVANWVQNRYGN